LLSCANIQKQKLNSRVLYFHYGGYGDTVYATLEGTIFLLDTSSGTQDSLTEVPGVKIETLEKHSTSFSDSNGRFVITLDKGVFSFLLTKEGYQPLLIKHYVSDPDQYSEIKINLEQGTEQQTYIIPKNGTD